MNEEKEFWIADDIRDPMFREEMAWRIELRELDRHFENTTIVFVLLVLISLTVMYFF